MTVIGHTRLRSIMNDEAPIRVVIQKSRAMLKHEASLGGDWLHCLIACSPILCFGALNTSVLEESKALVQMLGGHAKAHRLCGSPIRETVPGTEERFRQNDPLLCCRGFAA